MQLWTHLAYQTVISYTTLRSAFLLLLSIILWHGLSSVGVPYSSDWLIRKISVPCVQPSTPRCMAPLPGVWIPANRCSDFLLLYCSNLHSTYDIIHRSCLLHPIYTDNWIGSIKLPWQRWHRPGQFLIFEWCCWGVLRSHQTNCWTNRELDRWRHMQTSPL